jgi:hypothetical protein
MNMQCTEIPVCEVFQEGDMCRTISAQHGSPCILLHILDESLLANFLLKNCSSVVGGLSLDNLPRHLDEDALGAAFQGLRAIIGTLTVIDNQYLTSLSFLKNLQLVKRIVIHNNPMLIDARLPSLDPSSLQESHDIFASKNPRLHPTRRYPLSAQDSTGLDECISCPHLSATFALRVTTMNGSISTTDFLHFMSNVVLGLNETSLEVVSPRSFESSSLSTCYYVHP